MKSPMRNLLPLTVKAIAEKSGFPMIAAMSGVSRSFTSAATTAPKAPPITTATARSTTLPRSKNALNPFSIVQLLHSCEKLSSRREVQRLTHLDLIRVRQGVSVRVEDLQVAPRVAEVLLGELRQRVTGDDRVDAEDV